jgi:hypothetical protein
MLWGCQLLKRMFVLGNYCYYDDCLQQCKFPSMPQTMPRAHEVPSGFYSDRQFDCHYEWEYDFLH